MSELLLLLVSGEIGRLMVANWDKTRKTRKKRVKEAQKPPITVKLEQKRFRFAVSGILRERIQGYVHKNKTFLNDTVASAARNSPLNLYTL